MKKKISGLTLGLLIALFLLLGFGGSYYYKTIYTKTRFEHFLDESFRYMASENALTLHMNLQHPEKYGIQQDQVNLLPDLSEKALQKRFAHFQDMSGQLHQFKMENLSKEQQFLALLLEYNLEEYLTMEKEFPYYKTNLGPNGSLVDLSILLSEFPLENREDIALYEKLLGKIPTYLDSIVSYERKRQKSGIDPTPSLIDGTIDHIDQLIESPDSNIYTESYKNRVKEASFLSESEKRTYLQKNETLVAKIVLPAYEKTRSAIKNDLKPSKKNLTVASYPNGKEYFSHLLTSEVGSSLSPQDCHDILSKDIENQEKVIKTIYQENPDIELEYLTAFPVMKQADEMLNDLKNVTKIEFPAIEEFPSDILEIADSLNSISANAYYVTPPLDYEGSNHIFLRSFSSTDPKLYTTLAHEGYPGHMYQTNYFYQNLIHPIQLYLKMPGYNEGWGTYAEYYSYDFLTFQDMDEQTTGQVKSLMRANSLLTMDLSCMADLMINYFGYDKNRLADYMAELSIDKTYSNQLYDYVSENPCNYLNYGIGYYEFSNLLQTEQEKADFSMLDFHTKVLSYGSCPFTILQTMMNAGENDLSFVNNNE